MRILITTGIFPPDIGGPATYVPIIAKALLERGHQVIVLTTCEPEHMDWDDSVHPFPVIRMNRRQKIWRRLPNHLAYILRYGRHADIIYANGIYLETVLANKLLRKPLVMKIVGDEAWERSIRKGWTSDSFEDFQHNCQSWQAELLKLLRSWCVKQADKIITPSQYLKRFATKWGVPEERCVVVYNAIEVSFSPNQEIKPPPNILNGNIRVITVGRLIPLKNVDKLLQAIAQIPQSCLTIVGDGPCKSELESMAHQLGISNRVWFTGVLPQSAVHTLMMQHDVFAIISSHEGFPFAAVEAMKLGLAVIASPVGGNLEIISDGVNGLLVEPKPETIANALQLLLTNPDLRKRLSLAGRQSAQERFNFAQMVEKTEIILSEV